MTKGRKILSMALVASLMASTLIMGCSNKKEEVKATPQATTEVKATSTPEPKPVTITYSNFSASGANQASLDKMKAEFEKSNSLVKVNIETVGYDDYFTQLQTKVASNTAADCYELNYENFVAYAKKSLLSELDGLFTETGFDKSVLNKNALEAFRDNGKQYGLPASFSNVLLFYNKDLFDKASVKYPTADWTWDTEVEAAQKIRALGKDIFGIIQPIQFWEFYKTVQQNGGSVLDESKTKFTVNTPQNAETLQFLVDKVNKTNVTPKQSQLAGMGDTDLFKSGRLGMLVTGVWMVPDFIKDCKFKWDVAVEPGKTKKATHFFANGLVINKNSKSVKQSFEWVKFMSSSKEAAKIRVDAGWELPAVTYPDILDAYMKTTPPENKKAVFDSLQYLVTPPVIEQFKEMTDILGMQLQAAADGAKTPAKALEDAQKELEAKVKLK